MSDHEAFQTSTSDRRRAQRRAIDSAVEVRIDTTQLRGTANNLSASGILFFTDGDLRVTVEVEEDGKVRTLSGSLVRCERIKGDHRGWAVEFDAD